jgi:hypothetical protein
MGMPDDHDGQAQQGSDLEPTEESLRFRLPFLVPSPEGLFDGLRLSSEIDVVAGRDHGLPYGVQLQVPGSVLNSGGLGGKADLYLSDARDAGHRILHTPNARGAGHAGDLNLLSEEGHESWA